MASSTEPLNITTFKAGGTIRKYRFVKIDDSNGTVSECDANGRAIGIGQNDASVSTGELLEVALSGGGAKLEVAEAMGEGKMITSTSVGKGEICDAAGEWIGAICFSAGGADGDVISVRIAQFQAHASDA
tara:strand:- start:206 stop:595 length:390 start_codon:yes stop_codon:yes gene_type:complete